MSDHKFEQALRDIFICATGLGITDLQEMPEIGVVQFRVKTDLVELSTLQLVEQLLGTSIVGVRTALITEVMGRGAERHVRTSAVVEIVATEVAFPARPKISLAKPAIRRID